MFQKKERKEREVAQSCPTLKPNGSYRRGLLCYLVVGFFFFSFLLVPMVQRAHSLESERRCNPGSAPITYVKLSNLIF